MVPYLFQNDFWLISSLLVPLALHCLLSECLPFSLCVMCVCLSPCLSVSYVSCYIVVVSSLLCIVSSLTSFVSLFLICSRCLPTCFLSSHCLRSIYCLILPFSVLLYSIMADGVITTEIKVNLYNTLKVPWNLKIAGELQDRDFRRILSLFVALNLVRALITCNYRKEVLKKPTNLNL